MKKLILLSIFLLCYLMGWGQSTDENKIVFISDPTVMPSYPGGESEMYKFINERLFYPWAEDSIKGRVIIRFRVDTLGDLRDIKVLRGLNPLADSIAVSIIREMPRWNIGMRYGKPLDILFTLPIVFDPTKIPADRKLSKNPYAASFPGGNEAMFKFICENLKYPYQEESVSGKLIIKFVVDGNGKICHSFVSKSLDAKMDAEALRVVRSMPDWVVPEGNVGCYLSAVPVIIRLQ